MRTIAHLDLDCFFVSCERIKNSYLNGKPVVVGGNPKGRGVVAAASYEVRKFGVHSAMPAVRAKRLCPRAVFLSPDFSCYTEHSRKVRHFLEEVAPVVEAASIDEFYLDLTGCHRIYPDLHDFAAFVKSFLAAELQLPATIAIGTSKLITKIAVGQAKPDGLKLIPEGSEAAFLAPLPVGKMPGIGKVTEQELTRLGYKTLGQIASASDAMLKKHFGVMGVEFRQMALGIDERAVIAEEDPKSMGRETTFAEDVGDFDHLFSVLSSFSEACCAELRSCQFKARTVTVKFRLSDFTTFERSKTIRQTNQDKEIFETVEALLRKNWKAGMKLRLIGMSLSRFHTTPQTLELFSDQAAQKRTKLTKQIDRVRDKFGFESIRRGTSLLSQ